MSEIRRTVGWNALDVVTYGRRLPGQVWRDCCNRRKGRKKSGAAGRQSKICGAVRCALCQGNGDEGCCGELTLVERVRERANGSG